MSRGKMIVVEGVDRAGKTSQCHHLLHRLRGENVHIEYISFPNRDIPSGKVIDQFLRREIDMNDEDVHLLFSQNRREMQQYICDTLHSGIHILIDRYAYSGVSYSVGKGMDMEWCKKGDDGNYRPDMVIYLHLHPSHASTRPGYGGERFEDVVFQQKVLDVYSQLVEDDWVCIDASQPFSTIHDQIYSAVRHIIHSPSTPLRTLW